MQRLRRWISIGFNFGRPPLTALTDLYSGECPTGQTAPMVMGLQVVRLLPQNATCQTFGWEDKSVRNSQTVLATMKESGNKDQVIRLRVSGAERDMFEAKAANYGSISAMIRDAVAHYDDTLMKRRIESMNLLYPLISKHESDLNRIGNNLNQVAHYCNLLAENNEYNMQVITSSVEPVLHQLLSLNSDIAATEHKIFTRIFSEKPV